MQHRRLFLGCFVSLIATALGFAVRASILEEWRVQFNLSYQEVGTILGAGLYPFAISIILFSLIIDRIGYGRSMVFAFLCHTISAVITISAPFVLAAEGSSPEEVASGQRLGYWMLYIGTFVYALGNGIVEAVINPVVATIYEKEKTHWLNILHAGWPGGLVLGGLLSIALGSGGTLGGLPGDLWQWKMALILLPVFLYGILLFGQKFPIHERVAAGVSYMDMLKEFGAGSCYIISFLLIAGFSQILGVFGVPTLPLWVQLVAAIAPTIVFTLYVQSFGRPMFVFMLLIMFLLATTELGTDSWISDIMRSVLGSPALGTLFLVYTSIIMFVLRFFAGPIVHRISPLGLLLASAAIACGGLLWLSAAGSVWWVLFLAATFYGLGKTFFWPTTLGVVSEQYPKGGALMLNAIAGVGMLSVGVLGGPGIGAVIDGEVDQRMQTLVEKQKSDADVHKGVNIAEFRGQIMEDDDGLLGKSKKVNQAERTKMNDKLRTYEEEAKKKLGADATKEQVKDALKDSADYQQLKKESDFLETVITSAAQGTLGRIAILPGIMFLCYLVLIVYFQAKGGYKAQVLTGTAADDEEFTGGVEGPVR